MALARASQILASVCCRAKCGLTFRYLRCVDTQVAGRRRRWLPAPASQHALICGAKIALETLWRERPRVDVKSVPASSAVDHARGIQAQCNYQTMLGNLCCRK